MTRLYTINPQPLAPHWRHLGPAFFLACFVLLLYAPLLFTNRVLASGDILLYFYPYRDYAADILRTGRIPLWNPYIFLGAPFLGNPQSAVLYPLHWPLLWLPITAQLYWSAALHTWMLGLGGYFLLRRLHLSRWAALIGGLVLAGSGFYGGLFGHPNQMEGATWLPWVVWVFLETGDWRLETGDWRLETGDWRLETGDQRLETRDQRLETRDRRVKTGSYVVGRLAIALSRFVLLVALMVLAGHTQTAYINLFGVGVWIVWSAFWQWRRGSVVAWSRTRLVVWSPVSSLQSLRSLVSGLQSPVSGLCSLLIYGAGVTLGALLSAAQLLPTLELSGLGLRNGGLTYGEASSFSLKPLHLLWTLLPSYGLVDLEAVFNTPGYTEYVAYVGIVGMALAGIGLWYGRGETTHHAWQLGLFFAGLGLFLALGRWNPFYFILYKLTPGFDLFRVPARWMMLYTLGMAVLAAVGAEFVMVKRGRPRDRETERPNDYATTRPRDHATQPSLPLHLVILSSCHLVILPLLTLDLLLAARALPHAHPTAPQAVYDVRTAPAHLRTDPMRAAIGPAAMGRFLGMSTITYDPGDLSDWRPILREGSTPQLDERAFAQFIIGLKIQELLAPNLSLFWRLPAVDGFDGGVLPLQRYNEFLTLFIPREHLVPDGRLREQVKEVPNANLLGLLNVQYLITDKVRDLWFEGVFYDRQIGARLNYTLPMIAVEAPHPFEATHIDLIGYVAGDETAVAKLSQQVLSVLQVEVATASGQTEHLMVTAGGGVGAHLADGELDSPMGAASGAVVAYRDIEGGRQEYRVRLPLAHPVTPTDLTLRRLETSLDVIIQALTLYDQRTGMFTSLLPSDRGRFRLVHSGDVKIYENLEVRPRAYLVHQVLAAASPAAALEFLRDEEVQAGRAAVVEGEITLKGQPDPQGSVQIRHYAPERIELQAHTSSEALLVLSDTAYPGWIATVDGVDTPIYTTNYLFRGVQLPPGEHTVVFAFQPASWRRGLWLSGLGVALWLTLLFTPKLVGGYAFYLSQVR